jgi:hypothetical protein
MSQMSRGLWVGLVAVSLLWLPACSSWENRHTKGVAIGGLAGGGLGALVGSALGSWGWGAVIGVGAGALAGYIIADSSASEPARTTGTADRRAAEADQYFVQARKAQTAAESEYYLKRSIELRPTAAAYNNLGLLYLQSGDRARAQEMWQKALDLDPGYVPARENLDRARLAS